MDFEFFQTPFHQTHYQFYYQILPKALRTPFMLNELIEAAQNGTGNRYLVGFWRGTAKNVYGLEMEDSLPAEVDVSRDDFTMLFFQPVSGLSMLVMTGVEPRGPVEAACAVAIFEDAHPAESLRFFTTESPMEPTSPWMVGEWYSDGSRSNLGQIEDNSAQALCRFVIELLSQ